MAHLLHPSNLRHINDINNNNNNLEKERSADATVILHINVKTLIKIFWGTLDGALQGSPYKVTLVDVNFNDTSKLLDLENPYLVKD